MGDLYSQTIKRGSGFVNILAHDPPEAGEEEHAEPMGGKTYDTSEEAEKAAADEAQADYDKQRADPSSDWYVGPRTPNLPPETDGAWNAEQDPPCAMAPDPYKGCR